MKLTEKIKKTLWVLFAVALVGGFIAWMLLNPGPEHIEDTNGPDNYALQQITEADVASLKMGSRGTVSTHETHWNVAGFEVSDGVEYASDKFTGVYSLYTTTIIKGSDIHLFLTDFRVNSGNFAFYVLLDGKIVREAKPDEFGMVELLIENIDSTATLEYVIAGESADFRFTAPAEW